MYFRDVYKPIPLEFNLVLAMLWRHPENVDLDRVKVVHYCAAVIVNNSFELHLRTLIWIDLFSFLILREFLKSQYGWQLS